MIPGFGGNDSTSRDNTRRHGALPEREINGSKPWAGPSRRRAALLCGLLISGVISTAWAELTKDYSVSASAVVQTAPPQIRLSWPPDANATGYTIYRKTLNAATWGEPLTRLPATATGFTDTNVGVGTHYEYRLSRSAFEFTTQTSYSGEGYLYAGINAPATHGRGKLILLVDASVASALSFELTRLQQDLAGDGWTVVRRNVARTASVPQVKAIITTIYNADPANVKALFLFGHVPVPYSGNLSEGHGPHMGAWPADAFYGDMHGAAWTDVSVNTNTNGVDGDGITLVPIRGQNRNIPGDGKYDQSILPTVVELQVGRVDLANMPSFLPKSEVALLRQYLNKNHNFRHKFITAAPRGLIDEKFGTFDGRAMAASGWRNFSAMFNAANIDEDNNNDNDITFDWFPRLANNSYLWAYGNAGGSYVSAGSGAGSAARTGIGETGPGVAEPSKNIPPLYNFVEVDTRAVFTMLFGSFFGDWDNTNNFLRAPLATTSFGLTSVWAGFPHWFFQHMGLGETIGFGTRLSQNSADLYGSFINRFPQGVYMALMGDPSLRLHPVRPAANLSANLSVRNVNLNWTASTDSNLSGYHIYRALNPNGPFTRLSGAPVVATNFTHSNITPGTYIYMVRTLKREVSASGSYFNLSQGIFRTISVP